MNQPLTITAFSTALFSTWIFVEDHKLLFDAGDGVSAGLGLKSRMAEHIFVSHADRDHVAGLLQLHQLNARDGLPQICYPQDCGSFPALREFMYKFDPQSGPATWLPLGAGADVPISKAMFVRARSNRHIQAPGQVKSFDFTLCERRRKLKPEWEGKSGQDIAELRAKRGDDFVTEVHVRELLGYSGDTPEMEPARWSNVEVLIHEATFLVDGESRGSHANLPQVLAAAASLKLQQLVLTHFSARYSRDEIIAAIRCIAARHAIGFPIRAVLPGETLRDVLASEAYWQPGQHRDTIHKPL